MNEEPLNNDIFRLDEDLVDDEIRYIKELYNDDKGWEYASFPLTFVIGFSENLDINTETLKNVWNYHVYRPCDFTDQRFGEDEKMRIRACASLKEMGVETLDSRSKNQTSSLNGRAGGFVRYLKRHSLIYDYELCAEITKEGEEDKALLKVRLKVNNEDIEKTLYETESYFPIIEVVCSFTRGDIVRAMKYNIEARHARIHDLKAFIEDLSNGFGNCVMHDIAQIAFSEPIKDAAIWDAMDLLFKKRLTYYTEQAAEQNSLKLNAQVRRLF